MSNLVLIITLNGTNSEFTRSDGGGNRDFSQCLTAVTVSVFGSDIHDDINFINFLVVYPTSFMGGR